MTVTIDDLIRIYNRATEVKETNHKQDLEAYVKQQADSIKQLLLKRAREGKLELRVQADWILPETTQIFKEEGYIVWENNFVVVIKIPFTT